MRSWKLAVGGIGTAMVLSACGGGFADESPEAILEAAEKDMKALSSVTMKGELTTDGQQVTVDMSLNTDGDCTGSIGMADGEAELLAVDGESWMKPDDAFWDSQGGAQAALIKGIVGDKWLVMPAGQEGFSEICDLDELLSEMGGDDDSSGEVKGTEEVAGQEAVEVATENDEGDPVTAWIAVDEPHHILKMEVTQGDEPGTITFSEFDEELDVQAPAEDDVVDLESLGG